VGRYVAAHRDAIRESFAQQTTDEHDRRSVRADRATHGAAAAGADAGPPVPEGVGAEVAADAGDPGAPPKNWAKHVADQALFHDQPLQPRLDAALAGEGHVFFVDAAHFVFGAFLGGLWSFTRSFVRAASGRPRFHVLGRHPRTDRRDQHRGREHRDDVRTAAKDRRAGSDGADHAGLGQRPPPPRVRRVPSRHRTHPGRTLHHPHADQVAALMTLNSGEYLCQLRSCPELVGSRLPR